MFSHVPMVTEREEKDGNLLVGKGLDIPCSELRHTGLWDCDFTVGTHICASVPWYQKPRG